MDATAEPPRSSTLNLGRLVNHGEAKERNSKVKVVGDEVTPLLGLFATRDIPPGEEILYDYGVKDLPWKKVVQKLYF